MGTGEAHTAHICIAAVRLMGRDKGWLKSRLIGKVIKRLKEHVVPGGGGGEVPFTETSVCDACRYRFISLRLSWQPDFESYRATKCESGLISKQGSRSGE